MFVHVDKNKIKSFRKAKHWSQEELSIASELSLRTIQRVESSGKASLETTKAIASSLNLLVEDLQLGLPVSSLIGEYKNIQLGYTIIVALVLVQIAMSCAVTNEYLPMKAYILGSLLLALLAFIFCTLTTQVKDKELKWYFGLGLIKKHLSVDEIVSYRKVRNKAWWGWGVRYTGNGWLYNVSGLNAIELKLTDDKLVRIGTDEPDELLAALATAKQKRSA